MGGRTPRPTTSSSSTRSTRQDKANEKAKAAGFDNWIAPTSRTSGLAAQPRPADADAWKTVTPDQHPDLDAGAEPVLLRGRHRGEPAPVHRQDPDDAGREPGGAEPAGHRRRVRPPGAAHRHGQAARSSWRTRRRANYNVRLDPALNGSDATLQINQSYEADPEIAKWLRNRDFRRALSLGIDRDQLNETFWLGVGVARLRSPRTSPRRFSPGPEWRTKWSTLDVKQANELLDKIGLDKKDGEGYRLRTDGKGRLRIELQTSAGAFMPYTRIAEMIAQQWKKIGIQADVKELERSLYFTRAAVQRAPDRDLGQRRHRDTSTSSRATPCRSTPWSRSWGSRSPSGTPRAASRARSRRTPQLLKALELFRSAGGKKAARAGQDRPGDLEDHGRRTYSIGTVGLSPATMGVRIVKHRSGEHPGPPDQRPALPDARHLPPVDVLLQG